ncbi:PEP-CTERM sorting domain-containing protein [Rubritalea spongiae]|uniref:PEP-CTERM sorting domain-containing protein n=1 Tax=Rubritalea spongiae TaxID=430797 RepID=A0ABW5E5G1_9BACT
MKITTLLSAGILASAATSQAATLQLNRSITMNFGTAASANAFSSITIADTATESFSGSILDDQGTSLSTGGSADVTFSATNNSGFATGRAATSNSLIANEATGFQFAPGAHILLTFSGLDDSLAYDLTGGYAGNNNFATNWVVDGQTEQANNYASFTDLRTDGSGNLVIRLDQADPNPGIDTANHIVVGTLTLTAASVAVPEPSSTALLGLGGLALVLRRRR